MMKQFYQLVLGVVIGLYATGAKAQLANPPYYIETIVHNGNYGEAGHDLSGYVTHRIYVQFQNPDNYLTSIFAAESPADCVQDSDSSLFFNFSCNVFQHEFGDIYGFNEVCLYPAIIPTSEFDSYLTIGQECQDDPNSDFVGFLGQCPTWQSDFEGPADANYYDGTNFFWDEAAIFAAPAFLPYPQSLSHADANNRVLIGQMTTCGDMNACINIQYIDQNDVTNEFFDLCFDIPFPCNNVFDLTPDITLAGCAGEDAIVEFDPATNGTANYTLYFANDILVEDFPGETGGLTITPIDQGDYYITMEDEIGCRDTTEVFSIFSPGAITFDAVLLTDILCFGETTGSIEVTCSGGTGDLTVVANNQQYSCGDVITGLGCGDYVITVTDENDCFQTETISVSCPDELEFDPTVTSIICYGDDDGSIIGDVTGGTGNLSVVWNYNTNPFANFNGPADLQIDITALDGGTYDVSVLDENGCELTDVYEITEPEEYIATGTITDASCFSFCDGTASYEITGGTAPYATSGTEIGGGNVNLNALCAGEYAILITDDNDCEIHDTITVIEPEDITFTLNFTGVTCFGQCDGEIEISDVTGGYDNFTYTISPDAVNCVAPCSGNEVNYTDVCAGTYDIVITDEGGCIKNVDDVIIDTPDPLQIVLTPQDITCFGYNNGELLVDVIGGTAPVIVTPGDSIVPYTFTDLAPGLYTMTVTDANNCSATGDVTINEPPILSATVIEVTNASCGGTCDGAVEYLPAGGTPPYDYSLLPTGNIGVGTGNISSLCAGEYELVLFDLYNCFDTMEFFVDEPDPLVIDVILNAPTCTGMFDGSAAIALSGGTGELTFFIEPDGTDYLQIDSVSYTLSNLGEGEVFFELEDEIGCRILDTLEIVPDIITDMVLTMFSTPETCWNEVDGTATVAVQNGFVPISYLWDDPNQQTTATASGLYPSQEYTVVVTDDIGCTLTGSVFVDPTEGCFFIATAITPNGDGVNDTWILGGLEYFFDCKINVFNRWGQVVYTSTGYSSQWDATFQGELLPVADYYFTIDYAPDKDVIMGTVTIKY